MGKDYYKILEVPFGCSSDDIKKSYRKLALKYHPDRNAGNTAYEEKFKLISEAYETLSNENRRIIYDYDYKKQFNENDNKAKEEEKKEESEPITPNTFLELFIEIHRKLRYTKKENILHENVFNRVKDLLDKPVLDFLIEYDDKETNNKIIEEVKLICNYLKYHQIEKICVLLSKLAASDSSQIEKIFKFQKTKKRDNVIDIIFDKIFPNLKWILFFGFIIWGIILNFIDKKEREKGTIIIDKPVTGELTTPEQEKINNDSINYYLKYADWDKIEYKTGTTPDCYSCKSRMDFEVNTKLIIYNNSSGDVVVKLINANSNRCVRYVYIRKGDYYDMKYIPLGKYYYKVGYGTDWRQKVENGKCVGKFIGSPEYKNSSKEGKYFEFDKNYEGSIERDGATYRQYSYGSYELTLTTVITKYRVYTNNISEEDFNIDN